MSLGGGVPEVSAPKGKITGKATPDAPVRDW